MTLPAAPPRYAQYKDMFLPIKKGEEGWRVYAVQTGIKSEPKPENVGKFTVGTVRAVKRWQKNHDLAVDGIVGPATQLSILLLAAKAADEEADLPGGTTLGFVVYEGGSLLAATNWNSDDGVDCGAGQWHVLGPPFNKDRLKFAFNPWVALKDSAVGLAQRWYEYRVDDGLPKQLALEAAVLFHNWQVGAQQIVQYGHVLRPDDPAEWTSKPGGGHYTRGEWAKEYPRRILSFQL